MIVLRLRDNFSTKTDLPHTRRPAEALTFPVREILHFGKGRDRLRNQQDRHIVGWFSPLSSRVCAGAGKNVIKLTDAID